MKARIQFKLPAPPPVETPVVTVNINYAITEKKVTTKEPGKSYSYTINGMNQITFGNETLKQK
jgi:hypothetical protein